MNDSRIIEELDIFGITIQPYGNGCANTNRIVMEFTQNVKTPYQFDDADHKSTVGKLVGKQGHYFGQMKHRFYIDKVDDAWAEIQRRARAYQNLEKELFDERYVP